MRWVPFQPDTVHQLGMGDAPGVQGVRACDTNILSAGGPLHSLALRSKNTTKRDAGTPCSPAVCTATASGPGWLADEGLSIGLLSVD